MQVPSSSICEYESYKSNTKRLSLNLKKGDIASVKPSLRSCRRRVVLASKDNERFGRRRTRSRAGPGSTGHRLRRFPTTDDNERPSGVSGFIRRRDVSWTRFVAIAMPARLAQLIPVPFPGLVHLGSIVVIRNRAGDFRELRVSAERRRYRGGGPELRWRHQYSRWCRGVLDDSGLRLLANVGSHSSWWKLSQIGRAHV